MFTLWMVGCSAPTTDSGTDDIGKQEETVTTQKPVAESTNTPVPTMTNTPVPTATNTPAPTLTNTPTPTKTNTPTPTPVIIEELDEGYVFSLMSDVADKLMGMENRGEISGYKWGTSKFLVWKYASTNITGPKVYKFAIMNCLGEYETEFMEFEKSVENPEIIECLGQNIFKLFTKDGLIECYNADIDIYFSYSSQCSLFTEFSDGYALGYLNDTFRYEEGKNSSIMYIYKDVVFLSEFGEMKGTSLEYKYCMKAGSHNTTTTYPVAGKYSDGYFFLDNKFYNINSEIVLDIGAEKVANEPYFDEGCCWIEYEDSGAMWGAYIDIKGNFLAEPGKLYDLD